MAKLKSQKGKKKINFLLLKKSCFRRVNYKKHFYTFPNIKCSTHIALISKIPFLLKKKQMDFLLFKLNRLLKKSMINIYSGVIFDKIITKKPKQSRMGKGKAEMHELVGNVSIFDTVFEFSFNIKEKKEKKKKMRKLLKNKIRLINLNKKFIFFNKNLCRYYKIFKLKRFIKRRKKKKKKKKIFFFNKKKIQFFYNFLFFYYNLLFKENCMFILLNYLFFFYKNKKHKYFSFISKMNYFFIKKNNLYSFDHLFLFFYRNNLLCKSILNFFLKYKFGIKLMIYPLEFENMLNGRIKNSLIGRR